MADQPQSLDEQRKQLPDSPGVYMFKDADGGRSEEHTSELQSQSNLVCRLLLEKKKQNKVLLDYSEFNFAGEPTVWSHFDIRSVNLAGVLQLQRSIDCYVLSV